MRCGNEAKFLLCKHSTVENDKGKLFKSVCNIMTRRVFRTQSNIYDGVFCEDSYRLKVINYFCKNPLSWMFD